MTNCLVLFCKWVEVSWKQGLTVDGEWDAVFVSTIDAASVLTRDAGNDPSLAATFGFLIFNL